MKRHVAATLLVLTVLGVLNTHVDLEVQDGRYFGVWQGKKHDVIGWLTERHNQLQRDCSNVQNVPANSPTAVQVLALISEYSPPDSRRVQLVSLQQHAGWLVAELSFETLNPAVVLLRQGRQAAGEAEKPALHLPERAIWSGSTTPWRAGPRIRAHLQAQVLPGATKETPDQPGPATLLACYEPVSAGLR